MYDNQPEVATDRPQRDIEGLIQHAKRIRSQLNEAAERLRDMRRRLIGMDEGTGPEGPKVKEAVSSEVHDLRDTLNGIDETTDRILNHITNLESV